MADLEFKTAKGGHFAINFLHHAPTADHWVVVELPGSQDGDSWSELKTAVTAQLSDLYADRFVSVKMGYDEIGQNWPITVTIKENVTVYIMKMDIQTKEKSIYKTIVATIDTFDRAMIDQLLVIARDYASDYNNRIEYCCWTLTVRWDGGGVCYYAVRP